MRDILFVDDERELLDGLRARLYKHRRDWNMTFVLSGDEAIATLEKKPMDLIVSDVRMPGMDGGQLLTLVKERWPKTIRIIVSGYSDPVQAVRLTSLAHQYIAKPCDGRVLENIIERCFNLQDLLAQDTLRQMVGRIGKLPALPKTYGKLQAALAKPTVAAAEIERVAVEIGWFAGAERVRTEVWLAVMLAGLNDAVTPEGSPETLRGASWLKPEVLAS